MANDYTVADLVAEFLSCCGVATAFGVISVHNIPMLDAVGRRNVVRFVMARGELGAAHMADGLARVSGGLGAVFSSTGPGAANAACGLLEARFAGSPVLHITGQTLTRFADRELGTVHDAYNQLGMLKAVSKTAYRIRSASQALGVLTRAATDALTPPMGPVSVEIPIDIQRTAIARPAILDRFVLPVPAPQAPEPAALDELAEQVLAAQRPMLWLGAGARAAGEAAMQLLDLGFCMVSSLHGRGTVPEDHPFNLGGLNGFGVKRIEDFYRTVDVMLVVGSRLRGHELGDFSVVLPRNLVQIDVDPMANGRSVASSFFVCGDARLVLEGLVRRIEGRLQVAPTYQEEFRLLKQVASAEYLDTLGVYGSFSRQLRAAMPRDAIWVRDVTQNTYSWGNRIFPTYSPRDNVYPVSAGIGQGLPLGIGAAVGGGGRKAVLMTGDGGFYLNFGELWTVIQEKLNLTVIVMNNKGYGAIKKIQDRTQNGRHFFGDLLGPDLRQVAALAGLPFWKVQQPDAFGATMRDALAVDGPALVEVDMTAIGKFS